MNKKLLFITSRLLWPVDGGRKTSLNYYCKGLHEKFGYDVYLYCFLEAGQSYQGKHPDYIKDVYIAEEVGTVEKIKNIFGRTIGNGKWPLQCSLYYSKANEERIRNLCNEMKPDVVFTEMIRTATYFECFAKSGVKTVANLDDLLSKRYRLQAKSKKMYASGAGAYSGKLPAFVNRIANNTTFNRLFLNFEAKRCELWEEQFYNIYDYCMFTSPLEVDEINAKMRGNKALTLSVGVDYELFSRNIPGLEKESNTLSYVGNFNVAANRDTLRMICKEILPLIKIDYKLYVIGTCSDEIINEYANDKVVFTGRVEDLAETVRKTEIFLSPIAYGTGIKTKIVEAMAMGMPVITNSVGAEGIGGINGTHYVIEEEPSDIVCKIEELLADQSRLNDMGRNAQKFSYENFRWDIVYGSFEKAGL